MQCQYLAHDSEASRDRPLTSKGTMLTTSWLPGSERCGLDGSGKSKRHSVVHRVFREDVRSVSLEVDRECSSTSEESLLEENLDPLGRWSMILVPSSRR